MKKLRLIAELVLIACAIYLLQEIKLSRQTEAAMRAQIMRLHTAERLVAFCFPFEGDKP